jgi:hypothetical protein
MSLLDDRLSALAAMSQAQLRAEWRRVHKGQVMPSGLGRDLASRAIAWRMQEHLNGGLPPAALRELNRLARQIKENGDLDISHELRLKPGTKLVREWHRRIYHVLVLEDGFQFEDRHYRSLTGIAREITGAAWSGPRFFGVKGKANVPPSR